MSNSVPKKQFKGSGYWHSLSMQEKYDAYVIMNNGLEKRLWMDNADCAIDGTILYHLLDLGFRFQDDLL